MNRIVLIFASAKTAATNLAGVPAIARAIREAASAAQSVPKYCEIVLALPDGRLDDSYCKDEIARLAPGAKISWAATAALTPVAGDLFFAGELQVSEAILVDALRPDRPSTNLAESDHSLDAVLQFYEEQGHSGLTHYLRDADREIVRDLVKPSDGIVSRYLNRPISTRISSGLLQFRAVRPIHATAVAALTASLMFGCLISGSYFGLIVGAILFQVASVIDGVDGEIARATFRTTARGATLDSLTDAATNLAFLMGLGIGLAQQGADDTSLLGVWGFACLGTGLVLLGGHATRSGRPVNFDALKHVVRQQHSALGEWIIWLTMRDFLALGSAIMVILGFGHTFLQLFLVGSFLWLIAAIGFILSDAMMVLLRPSRK